MKRGRFSDSNRSSQMDISVELTDREYTAINTTTVMDKLASKTADDGDRTASVSRCMDDRNTTEDRRQMSSSDNPCCVVAVIPICQEA